MRHLVAVLQIAVHRLQCCNDLRLYLCANNEMKENYNCLRVCFYTRTIDGLSVNSRRESSIFSKYGIKLHSSDCRISES